MMKIFSIFAGPLGWLMSVLYNWVGSYFLTILLFTVLVRLLMFPLSLRSQKMQADRARLAPRLDRIQKKYAGNQQKMMEKQQELFQKEGVSMTAGCLPSIVQMLVLMSVIAVIYKPLTYLQKIPAEATTSAITVLAEVKDDEGNPVVTAAETKSEYYRELTLLKHAENYPTEVKKALADAKVADVEDTYATIVEVKKEFSVFGLSLLDMPWQGSFTKINWLWMIALLSGLTAMGTSVISMRFMKATQPDQPGQGCMNNSMMFMMPAMSLFISFSVPAGVGLYWILSNLLSMVQTVALNMIYNPVKIRAQAYVDYEERRRRKKEDKKRLAEARAKEDAARAAEKEQEPHLPSSTSSADAQGDKA